MSQIQQFAELPADLKKRCSISCHFWQRSEESSWKMRLPPNRDGSGPSDAAHVQENRDYLSEIP